MKEGDYLVGIGDEDVKWNTHAEVVNLIKVKDFKGIERSRLEDKRTRTSSRTMDLIKSISKIYTPRIKERLSSANTRGRRQID